MSTGAAPFPANRQRSSDHTAQYETLRSYAVERHAPASRDGLVVLMRQGLAAWMDAWSRLPEPPPRSAPAECRRQSLLPEDASAEVVLLLAAMTLGHIQEGYA